MKAKRYFLTFLFFLFFTNVFFAQNSEDFYYEYTYDDSGNRIKRAVFEIPDIQQQEFSEDSTDNPLVEEITMSDEFSDHNNNDDTFFYANNELSDIYEFEDNVIKNEDTENQLGIETKIGKHMLSVYPNPVREILRIEFDGLIEGENAYWQLVDMQGRTLKTQAITKHTEYVMFSNIQPGTYLLVVFIGNDKQEFKIIRH